MIQKLLGFIKTIKGVISIAATVAILIIVVTIFFKLKSCGNSNITNSATTTPKDTNYIMIQQETYRPPSISFLSKKKPPAKLPEGVKEKDIKRIISIQTNPLDTIDILESINGDVYIKKDTSISKVTVTNFEPPVFRFTLDAGVGGTVNFKKNNLMASPAGFLSLMEWYGRVQIPVVAIDFNGLNLGGQYRIYYNVHAGITNCWNYGGGSQIKASLSFMF